jgi:hypothetical protein
LPALSTGFGYLGIVGAPANTCNIVAAALVFPGLPGAKMGKM